MKLFERTFASMTRGISAIFPMPIIVPGGRTSADFESHAIVEGAVTSCFYYTGSRGESPPTRPKNRDALNAEIEKRRRRSRPSPGSRAQRSRRALRANLRNRRDVRGRAGQSSPHCAGYAERRRPASLCSRSTRDALADAKEAAQPPRFGPEGEVKEFSFCTDRKLDRSSRSLNFS